MFPYEVPGSINAQGIPNSIAAFGVCVLMHVYKNHMIKVKAGIAILQTNYFSAIQCIQCGIPWHFTPASSEWSQPCG